MRPETAGRLASSVADPVFAAGPGTGVLDGALVRVTVSAGARRVDLALPGAVPVAELVPELAAGLGVLHASSAHLGFRLVGLDGRALTSSRGLRAQGVLDGGLLTLLAGAEPPPPARCDDPAHALAADVARDVAGWGPRMAYGIAAVAGGTLLGIALDHGLARIDAGADPGVATSLACLLVGVVLGRGLFPRLALALSPTRSGSVDARRAYRILAVSTVTAGAVLIVAAPLVATLGRWGLALATIACLAVLLGIVRLPGVRAQRLVDLSEATLLAALLPLLVMVSGLLDRLPV